MRIKKIPSTPTKEHIAIVKKKTRLGVEPQFMIRSKVDDGAIVIRLKDFKKDG